MANYVPGMGNGHAKLMVVGEAPGQYEDAEQQPFVGPTGREVQNLLSSAGMPWSEVYRTNVEKYRPPQNDLRKLPLIGKQIGEDIPQLWEEIKAVKPNVILALGNHALKTLTGRSGITHWRGSIIPSIYGAPKIVPSIHPAAYLSPRGAEGTFKYSSRVYIALDFKRAVEQSAFPEFRLPERLIEIARNSLDVWRFLDQYKDRTKVAIDIEVIKCIPVCIGLAFSPHHAMSVPILNLQAFDNPLGIPQHEVVEIWKLLAGFFKRPGLQIIGQNFKFDHEKLRMPLGFVVPEPWFDTMFATATLQPEFPKSLEWQTSIYTEEPYYKLEGKEFNPLKDRWDNLFKYNAKDVLVTYEIAQREEEELTERGMREFFFDYIMQLHTFYMKLESVGIKRDLGELQKLKAKYAEWRARMQAELNDLVGFELNVNSPKQVTILLYTDLKCPRREGTDEDTLVALLNNVVKDPKRKRILNLIIDIRRLRKVENILESEPDYDGRMRCGYRIVGTETGRTSTSKMEPPVRPTKVGFPYQTMSKHGDIGGDVRSQYIADEGYEFIECDMSQAEARIVAHLAGDVELLSLFDTVDVHKMTASWFFGLPTEKITKEMRFVGKIGRHGGNYNMGKRRLAQEINSNARRFHIDIQVSEWKAGQISDIFHKKSPKIREVYHEEVRRILTETRSLRNPYGRVRQFYDRLDEDLFKEGFANLPQGTVSDHIKTTGLGIVEELYGGLDNYRAEIGADPLLIAMELHDAFVFLSRIEERERNTKLIKKWFERPINFETCSISRGLLTIPCEFKIGTNYGQLKDYHVVA